MKINFSKIKERAKDFYNNKIQPTVQDVSKRVKNGVQAFANPSREPNEQVNFQALSSETMQNNLAHSLTCPNCGGVFLKEDLTDGDEIVTCIYCSSTYSINDIFNRSTNERIEATRAQAYVAVENRKIDVKKEIALTKTKDKEQKNLDKLEKLKTLLDSGAITEKEYNRQKKKILSRFK